MNIDLSKFNNVDLNEQNYTTTYRMQKVDQLKVSIDTMERDFQFQRKVFSDNFIKKNYRGQIKALDYKEPFENDSLVRANVLNFLLNSENWKISQVAEQSASDIRSIIRNLENKKKAFFIYQKAINLHKMVMLEKLTLIFSCIFLFLIGASLGAIIKKGGLGLPMVLSVIIFLSYHYIGIFAKNAAEDNSIDPSLASWISTMVLAPFAFYLTKRASADAGFINLDIITVPIQKIFSKYLGSKS
jgi:lipopolysaccharide export system permease protein